jgi:hypothetical protein
LTPRLRVPTLYPFEEGDVDRAYYQALLRELPTEALLRSAGRRAKAWVQRRFAPGPAPWAAPLFKLGGEQLVETVLSPRRGWSDVSRRESVLQALAALPGAKERALVRARAALERRFPVFGQTLEVGAGRAIPWSLDVASGHNYPRVPAAGIPLLTEGQDPKFPWALGRLDSLIALGQGYWLCETKDREGYARELVAQTHSFLDENPLGRGVHWLSSMEVSLRAVNMAQALLMFRDARAVRDADWLRRMLGSIAEHLHHVEHNLEELGAAPNNHLIGDLLGLFMVGLLFPELPGAQSRMGWVRTRLGEELARQVHPDGCSFEGSVSYHRLVLEMATLAHWTAVLNGTQLGPVAGERLRRMFRFARILCSERGLAPQIGDNDSGRVFPLRDRLSLDLGYLAPLGAALLGAPELKDEAAELPDEAAWLLGAEGLSRFLRLKPSPCPSGISSPAGGLHVLRSPGVVLTVSSGRSGQEGVGGHSHNDKLSFELHLDGAPTVVDPGTPTFVRDLEQRNRFRSTRSHNTLQLDELEQRPILSDRPFALVEASDARILAFQPSGPLSRLTAAHSGFGSVDGGGPVERTFLLDRAAGRLTIEDRVEGQGTHLLRVRLHFPDRSARLREATEAERQRALGAILGPLHLGRWVLECGPSDAPSCVMLFDEWVRAYLEDAPYSPGYGECLAGKVLVCEASRALPARLSCVLLFGPSIRPA